MPFLQQIELQHPVPETVTARLLPLGKYQLPGIGTVDITRDMIERMKDHFDQRVMGTDVPVLVARHMDEKMGTAGWVAGLESRQDGLYAHFKPTEMGRKLLEDDQFRYVSANFARKWKHPETGKMFDNVLVEMTLTNFPALLGKAQIMLEVDGGYWLTPLAQQQWRANRPRFPLDDSADRAWDADAAESRWRSYVTEEGEVDFGEYRRGFMANDASNPDRFGSYKLLVVDVVDGQPRIIRRAVIAVQGVLAGARGGVDLPDEVKQQVRSAADALRKRFDKEAVEMTGEEIKTLLDSSLKPLADQMTALKTQFDGLQSLVDEQKKKADEQRAEALVKQLGDELGALRFERKGDSVQLSASGNLAIPPAVANSHARLMAKLTEAERSAELNALKAAPPTLVPLGGSGAFTGSNGKSAPADKKEAGQMIALKMRELHEAQPEWESGKIMLHLRKMEPDLIAAYEKEE